MIKHYLYVAGVIVVATIVDILHSELGLGNG